MQKEGIALLSALGGKNISQKNEGEGNSIPLGIFLSFRQETTYTKNIYPEATIDLLVNYVTILVVKNVSVSSVNEKKKAYRLFLHFCTINFSYIIF